MIGIMLIYSNIIKKQLKYMLYKIRCEFSQRIFFSVRIKVIGLG